MTSNDGKKRITIIGLGLIGGSIGLALKKAGPGDVEIVGHSRQHGTETQAERLGAIDRGEHNLSRAVQGAGLVIIATPVLTVGEVMAKIAGDLAEGAVVTDVASTKANVMQWAKEVLPPHVSFVGGHPMAGKENQKLENAEADLFLGKAYCICPAVEASESSVKTMIGLARLIGAEPVFVDPAEHDMYAAAVSHLPLMVATALFTLVRSSRSWADMGMLASSGFRDTTRLASGDPQMAHDIVVTNREPVIHWLERMEGELRRLRGMLQDSRDEDLLRVFAKAQLDRNEFLARPPSRTPGGDGSESASEQMKGQLADLIVGGLMARRLRQMRELSTRPETEEPATGYDKPRRPSMGERIAEDIRRDLEKLEQKRAEKEARKQGDD